MKNTPVIRGAGGGKGGGGASRVAVEASDNLRSKQFARILDLLGEGEIEGLVDGLKSIQLNGTPLQNADGTYNFKDVVVDSRTGTQAQAYVPGFNTVESTIAVGTEVKNALSITRSITDPSVDAIRVTLTVPALTDQNTTNGDLRGSAVSIAIDRQIAGGGFVQVKLDTIRGKTTSPYQISYRIELPGVGPWDIRVRRTTADSTSAAISNKVFWADYTTLIDQKLRYPNSALVGISIDAAQFNAIPTRGYDVKLLKILVPSNYFPLTRKYTRSAATGADTGVEQVWDGSFYVAWSDNPAWCWYDLVTAGRYGLGEFISPALVDKWQMYTIGKYCDALVPNGLGGMEPRYTCNIYMQTREEAYKVINSMASIFRGMAFWAGGGMTATHDAPADPIALFTQANIIGGAFNYSGSSLKARHTVALVSWNDPTDSYKQKVEYVEDSIGVARYGVVQTELVAIGCTSRGQAHRVGKWLLFTERLETEIVTFKAGLDGSHVYPGAVIKTQDASRAGKRLGGRLVSATTATVSVDAPITFEAGKVYTLSVILPDSTIAERVLTNAAGVSSTLSFTAALTAVPQPLSVWVVSVNDLVPELWRVVAVKEVSKGQIEVVAVEHTPGRYNLIEQGIAFESAPTTAINVVSAPPTNLSATTYVGAQGELEVIVTWLSAIGTRAATVMWRKNNDNYVTVRADANTFTITGASPGIYTILVSTTSSLGIESTRTRLDYTVSSVVTLPDVTLLALKQPFVDRFASFKWASTSAADGYLVQIVVAGVVKRQVTVLSNWFIYDYAESTADGGGTPFRSFEFRVKAKYGTLLSTNWVTITATNVAPDAPAATIIAITKGIQISAPLPPSGSDYAGMLVWISTVINFVPGATNLKYDGVNNSTNILDLTAGVVHYVRVAFYDVFGKTGLITSGQYTTTPLFNTANIPVVDVLPAPATATEGQVVYLTTDDKLYRFNGTAWITSVTAADITGQLAAGQIASLAASQITGQLTASQIASIAAAQLTGQIVGSQITAGTITAGNIAAATITGTQIAAGSIAAANIVSGSLTTTQIQAGGITVGSLAAGSVNAAAIIAGSVTSDKITVANLSALTANMGTITAGNVTLDAAGFIQGGSTGYLTGTGFWMGYSSAAPAAYKFHIGDPLGRHIAWTGSDLVIKSEQLTLSGGVANFKGGINISTGKTPAGNAFEITSAGVVWADNLFPRVLLANNASTDTNSPLRSSCASPNEAIIGAVVAANGSASAHGVRGINHFNGTSGLVGVANGFDFYADGTGTNYGPFTGTHEALVDLVSTFVVGDIVIDKQIIERNGISSAISLVVSSTIANQAAALGVVCAQPKPLSSSEPSVYIKSVDPLSGKNVMKASYATDAPLYRVIPINGVGEGQINVCGEGGNILAGDFICASSVLGKGMKQADTAMRNYTVAKARETVVFAETEVKQIACIYLCG